MEYDNKQHDHHSEETEQGQSQDVDCPKALEERMESSELRLNENEAQNGRTTSMQNGEETKENKRHSHPLVQVTDRHRNEATERHYKDENHPHHYCNGQEPTLENGHQNTPRQSLNENIPENGEQKQQLSRQSDSHKQTKSPPPPPPRPPPLQNPSRKASGNTGLQRSHSSLHRNFLVEEQLKLPQYFDGSSSRSTGGPLDLWDVAFAKKGALLKNEEVQKAVFSDLSESDTIKWEHDFVIQVEDRALHTGMLDVADTSEVSVYFNHLSKFE